MYDLLSQGRPCIAFIKTGEFSFWDENVDRMTVVVGLENRYIYLNDPVFANSPKPVERKEFDLARLE